jgi:hypothetical protein
VKLSANRNLKYGINDAQIDNDEIDDTERLS